MIKVTALTMINTKFSLLFTLIITNSNIFTVGQFSARNESPILKNFKQSNFTCKGSLSQKPECAKIFTTVAVIRNGTPNRSEILRNDFSFITTADEYLIKGSEFFSSEEYCIVNSTKESTVVVEVCERNCYQNSTWRPCIPKCCPWGEFVRLDMDTGHGYCVSSNEPIYTWKPDIYGNKNYMQPLTDKDYTMGFNPHYYLARENNITNCNYVWIWDTDNRFSFHILQNGNVRWRYQTNKWFKVYSKDPSTFCLDKTQYPSVPVLRICYSELVDSYISNRKLYAGLAFVSAFFIFLLLMMYGFLAKEQNSHGWIQFLFFVSLFFYHFLEGIGLLILPEDLEARPICFTLSVANHFFFTLTTATLVTLSWDIFWTFWTMHPSNVGPRKGLRRFYISVAVSCSSTFILVTISVVLNLLKSPSSIPYGLLFCAGGRWDIGKYFQIGFVFFSLVTLFSTICVVYRHKSTTKILAARARSYYKDLGIVFLKLIIVQGGTWTCIIVINLLKNYHDRKRYSSIIQGIKCLESVLLFILFAWDKRKLKSLEEKYPRFKGLSDALCSLCRRKIRKNDEDKPLVAVAYLSVKKDIEHK